MFMSNSFAYLKGRWCDIVTEVFLAKSKILLCTFFMFFSSIHGLHGSMTYIITFQKNNSTYRWLAIGGIRRRELVTATLDHKKDYSCGFFKYCLSLSPLLYLALTLTLWASFHKEHFFLSFFSFWASFTF